jgi:hypothetical protein
LEALRWLAQSAAEAAWIGVVNGRLFEIVATRKAAIVEGVANTLKINIIQIFDSLALYLGLNIHMLAVLRYTS